jgi:hypothetical protein
VGLKVFVRDKAITIHIELLEDLESPWLATAEGRILNIGQQLS